ncbi:MAG: hypothetical protein A3F35_03100 [Candidatus Woykebacteria bacterium RIFCSPHIGHO2_12_FULL_45_10]|uniref:Enolase n=1 Tax=Candidatus Woykebacteria bacterium RIFCSPHIGHO2_12_FULL_45_10 TaxID=1802603 RepID=A0A1G1WN25_9BACT|nr:MAG: hypothetical protein A3F35_03100 [Candidatus Woykebacteria bacterium RIFCSPHIGHO2_12_FULL_45_10]
MIQLDAIVPRTTADSRGEATVEVTLTSGSFSANASVPCGKSKGSHEAFCHTIPKSIEIMKSITPALLSRTFADPADFDKFVIDLDGTSNKEKLGVNVTLSLSIAVSRLFAQINNLELYTVLGNLAAVAKPSFPRLFFNLINGGLHVRSSLKPLPFQEYLIIPKETSPKKSVAQAFQFIALLKKHLTNYSPEINYGDEGGLIVSGDDPEIGLKFLQEAWKDFGEQTALDFGVDAASSSLCEGGDEYRWNEACWTTQELTNLYLKFVSNYPILSIEDPFYEEAWKAWAQLNERIGAKVWVVGDDLTVTNVDRIKEAREARSINAVLIKPNQIGTVSETIDAIKLVKSFGWKIIVSHRSGETNDSFIADLAYGVGADGLKAGSPLQNERLVKYNRLIEIEQSLREHNL